MSATCKQKVIESLQSIEWTFQECHNADVQANIKAGISKMASNLHQNLKDALWDEIIGADRVMKRDMLFPKNKLGYTFKTRKIGLRDLNILGNSPSDNATFFIMDEVFGDPFTDLCMCLNGFPVSIIRIFEDETDMIDNFERFQKTSIYHSPVFECVQVFIFTCGNKTVFFSEKNCNRPELAVRWADVENEGIDHFDDLCLELLPPETFWDYLSNYIMVACAEDAYRFVPLKPYQYRASKAIINLLQAYDISGGQTDIPQGHISHSTGSGKTYTMFATALNALKLKYVDKVLIIADRKELYFQLKRIRAEITGCRQAEVSKPQDKHKIMRSLRDINYKENPGMHIEIAIMGTASNISEDVRLDDRVLILFDESHRSQNGANHTKIRRMSRSPFFGFTGTPLHAENATHDGKTTYLVFGDCLHKYLISDAMEDGNVLPMRAHYHNIAHEKDVRANVDASDDETIDTIANWVCEHHDRFTLERKCSAILTGSGVPNMLKLYKRMLYLNESQGLGLKIAASVSVGWSSRDEIAATSMDNEEGEERDAEEETVIDKGSAAADLMDLASEHYAEMFDDVPLQDLRKSSYSRYRAEIAKSINTEGGVDILIVVGQFITGFDAARVNTVYVAKKDMLPHNIIQTISRTNRLGAPEKREGRAVFFYDMQKNVNAAIRMYSDGKIHDLNEFLTATAYAQCLIELREKAQAFYAAYDMNFKRRESLIGLNRDAAIIMLMDLNKLGINAEKALHAVVGHIDHVSDRLPVVADDLLTRRMRVKEYLMEQRRSQDVILDKYSGDIIIQIGEQVIASENDGLYAQDEFRRALWLLDPAREENKNQERKHLLYKAIELIKDEDPLIRNLKFEDIVSLFMTAYNRRIHEKIRVLCGDVPLDKDTVIILVLNALQDHKTPNIEDLSKLGIKNKTKAELLIIRRQLSKIVREVEPDYEVIHNFLN